MGKANTVTAGAPHLQRPRSLWVDDEPDEISRLQNMLMHYGMLVDVVESSHKAKEEVRDHAYDLMLLDLRLKRSDGIKLSRYARKVIDKKYKRLIHFIAVTNFKHEYADELRNDGFTFVYEKDELENGKSKTFVENCFFSAVDSRVRADYPDLMEKPVPQSVEPRLVEHIRCDVGYVLRLERSEALVRLWRRGSPGERTIRVFDRSFLKKRGVAEQGQPFRIDAFEGTEDKALVTMITPLHETTARLRRRIAPEIDLERFREGTRK